MKKAGSTWTSIQRSLIIKRRTTWKIDSMIAESQIFQCHQSIGRLREIYLLDHIPRKWTQTRFKVNLVWKRGLMVLPRASIQISKIATRMQLLKKPSTKERALHNITRLSMSWCHLQGCSEQPKWHLLWACKDQALHPNWFQEIFNRLDRDATYRPLRAEDLQLLCHLEDQESFNLQRARELMEHTPRTKSS